MKTATIELSAQERLMVLGLFNPHQTKDRDERRARLRLFRRIQIASKDFKAEAMTDAEGKPCQRITLIVSTPVQCELPAESLDYFLGFFKDRGADNGDSEVLLDVEEKFLSFREAIGKE